MRQKGQQAVLKFSDANGKFVDLVDFVNCYSFMT